MKIIIDTNFLVESIRFKINIAAELNRICDFQFDIYVLSKSLDELKKIIGINARVALSLMSEFKIFDTIHFQGMKVDDILLELSSNDTIIGTQDKELKKKIKKKLGRVIIIRQKKFFAFG